MIRLQIVANRKSTADDLARLLASEDMIEVVQAGALAVDSCAQLVSADVVLAVNLVSIHLASSKTPVVLLSNEPGPISAGFHACLAIDSSPQAIAAAVVAAAAGLYTLTSDQLHLGSLPEGDDMPQEKLTVRELEVLSLMSDGLGNKEIAGQLNISNHTAKFHVGQIMAKLRAGSRTEAVRIGIRRGLVAL